MDELEKKRIEEKQMVGEMIDLYCRKRHSGKKAVCEKCHTLKEYAHRQTDKCPYMAKKTFCVNCPTHCYHPEMREQIRAVMRFSGPRMLFIHPGIAIKHVLTRRGEYVLDSYSWVDSYQARIDSQR